MSAKEQYELQSESQENPGSATSRATEESSAPEARLSLARHAARLPARQAQWSAGTPAKPFQVPEGRLTHDRRASKS